MILALFAALTLQTDAAPDAATATLEASRQCLAVMLEETESAGGQTRVNLDDGREASVTIGRDGCSLEIDGWRDDGGAYATRVRDGLLTEGPFWTVTQWRRRQVNESGSTLWTTLVIPDIRRHSAYWVQIIEPGPGAAERLSVSFGIGP